MLISTSSTPSSPAPFPTSSNPSSATTPPNPSPGQRDGRFNFPDISAFPQAASLPDAADSSRLEDQPKADLSGDHEVEAEEPEASKSEAEDDEDEVDDLPSSLRPWPYKQDEEAEKPHPAKPTGELTQNSQQ